MCKNPVYTPPPHPLQGDSACERVFTVNDVSHGGCKYGIMNFSSSSQGSLSVEMCDNLYFTNRKVGASLTDSECVFLYFLLLLLLYLHKLKVYAKCVFQVNSICWASVNYPDSHVLYPSASVASSVGVRVFKDDIELRVERCLCVPWRSAPSGCVWSELRTPPAASVYFPLPSSATPTQVRIASSQSLSHYLRRAACHVFFFFLRFIFINIYFYRIFVVK